MQGSNIYKLSFLKILKCKENPNTIFKVKKQFYRRPRKRPLPRRRPTEPQRPPPPRRPMAPPPLRRPMEPPLRRPPKPKRPLIRLRTKRYVFFNVLFSSVVQKMFI